MINTKIDVPIEIVDDILHYCESQSIYDKLGFYGDFYYKLKKVKDEHTCQCGYCKKSFVYCDDDVIDASEPEKESFWLYVRCPFCGEKHNI